MTIKTSCIKPKFCTHCKDDIYTFEFRKNRNSKSSKHLFCSVANLHSGSIKWIKSIAKYINNNH
jgi:hypothetical protein